jgi:hypothetical protein
LEGACYAYAPLISQLFEGNDFMKQLVELTLPEGRSIFVETEMEGGGPFRELSGGTKETVKKAFDEVSQTLGAVAENIEKQLSALARKPSKVSVEIKATIKAGGNIFIANGAAEGGVKLTLTWEPEKPKTA